MAWSRRGFTLEQPLVNSMPRWTEVKSGNGYPDTIHAFSMSRAGVSQAKVYCVLFVALFVVVDELVNPLFYFARTLAFRARSLFTVFRCDDTHAETVTARHFDQASNPLSTAICAQCLP